LKRFFWVSLFLGYFIYFVANLNNCNMKKMALSVVAFLLATGTLFAKGGDDSTKILLKQLEAYMKLQDSVKKALKYETGIISLPSGVVKLNVPKGFKYLGVDQSRYVIQDLWGNLPQQHLQGMLFPESGHPFNDSTYAYVIEYNPVGYVKDADAKDINYDDLLKEMKSDDAEENAKRKALGGTGMYTDGWAAKPFYDQKNKILHWALDIRVEGAEEHTLNYKVITLGRKGILTMSAVSGMEQLDLVRGDVDEVLSMAEFTEGNRYADFDSNVDDVAAWTVGGLVAGKVLLKTAAGAGILKFLKFIIIGIIAAGGAIWKWITGRRKKEEEFIYEPQPAPVYTEEPLTPEPPQVTDGTTDPQATDKPY
jgi:uncharacterized membrane-anchored protein